MRTICSGLDDKCEGQITMNQSDIIAKSNWFQLKEKRLTYVSINTKQYYQLSKKNTVSSSAIMVVLYSSQGAGFKFHFSS